MTQNSMIRNALLEAANDLKPDATDAVILTGSDNGNSMNIIGNPFKTTAMMAKAILIVADKIPYDGLISDVVELLQSKLPAASVERQNEKLEDEIELICSGYAEALGNYLAPDLCNKIIEDANTIIARERDRHE